MTDRPQLTEWTWRHNNYLAAKDATTDRAEAEHMAHQAKTANPTADIGVMYRQVTPWQPAQAGGANPPVAGLHRDEVLRVLRRTFEHHFRPYEIAVPEKYAQLAVNALVEAGLIAPALAPEEGPR